MDFQPNTSLSLSQPNNQRNLKLVLDTSTSPSSSTEPRVFSCNYCQKKFYSSQALGGHQNAHKLERSLEKKSRELMMMRSSLANNVPDDDLYDLHGRSYDGFVEDMSHGPNLLKEYTVPKSVHQEELNHLDLSLRL